MTGGMNREEQDYAAWGLHVRSPIVLPFRRLPRAGGGRPDVTVRIGAAPVTLPAAMVRKRRMEVMPGAFLLNLESVARVLVTDGRDVLVEPCGGSDREIGDLIGGPPFAILLQQRGVIPFHAAAVETGAGAVLFLGPRHAGKSTLLGAMRERGYAMLADDVTGVVLDSGGIAVALPAFPRLRLWEASLHALGWRRTSGETDRGDGKYLVPVQEAAGFRTLPQPIRAACVLAPGERRDVVVEPVPCAAAFELLGEHTYRRRFLLSPEQRQTCFRTLSTMARRVPTLLVQRPVRPFLLDALAERVEEALGAPGRQGRRDVRAGARAR